MSRQVLSRSPSRQRRSGRNETDDVWHGICLPYGSFTGVATVQAASASPAKHAERRAPCAEQRTAPGLPDPRRSFSATGLPTRSQVRRSRTCEPRGPAFLLVEALGYTTLSIQCRHSCIRVERLNVVGSCRGGRDPFPAVHGQFIASQLRPFAHLGLATGLAGSSGGRNDMEWLASLRSIRGVRRTPACRAA
jgi:hypothetical protein